MNDRPLDCIGTSGPVGKHDFRLNSDHGTIRRIGSRPEQAAPVSQHTPQDHLDTVQRILERHRIKGSITPLELEAALDHLTAAREKLGMATAQVGEGI